MKGLKETMRALRDADPIQIDDSEAVNFIQNAVDRMPEGLFMPDLQWKHLVRSVLRGKNLMFVGPSRSGKTVAAISVAKVFNRPLFYFNLGSTQDPRTTLIGTREAKDGSTYFKQSEFLKAIQTPHSVILLDEISRAHPEAWNILMTPLDPKQRYVRADESEDNEVIEVAEGVTFIATANVGVEYTATRRMDKALVERFSFIEMRPLKQQDESDLLVHEFPNMDREIADKVSRIAHATRQEMKSESPQIASIMSTGQSLEVAAMMVDGFTLREAMEVVVYPHHPEDGGASSERAFIEKIVEREDADESEFNDVFGNDLKDQVANFM